MKAIVIGGGLSGLYTGIKLSEMGYEVTLLEKNTVVGGLASSFKIDQKSIPICYHHFMERDKTVINVIDDLGLKDDFYKKKVKMGFLFNGDKRIYKLSSPFDLLFFKHLTFWEKIKFAFFSLKIFSIKNWEKFHRIPAKDWLIKNVGESVYKKIFEQLLKTKFGKDSDKISASWMGIRLAMRESSGNFGYIKGGLEKLINRMKEMVSERGTILTNIKNLRIIIENAKIKEVIYEINGEKKIENADLVVCTTSIPELLEISELPLDYKEKLMNVRYKSTISAVIGLNKKLTDYYWINLFNFDFHIGGIFDHSNLNPEFSDSVLYLFTYIDAEDELYKKNEEEILGIYLDELENIFPNVRESVKWSKVFKLRYSKPIYEINYLNYMPSQRTPVKGLYLAGIGLIYPKIRNMGSALQSSIDVVETIKEDS